MARTPWDTSTRASRLPKDWAKTRRRVKARAKGRCEATTHDPRCNGVGSECDHIIPGDNHHISNLQWLNTYCHAAKTRRENSANNQRLAKLRRRPTETHPGKIC